MTSKPTLFTPLTLPNGETIPNRICKAAMEENLCDPNQIPGPPLCNLYSQWAQGGAGLIITGNVMVSPDAVTGPGSVILEQGTPLEPFAKWAQAGRFNGAQFWMQISHPGRQVYANLKEQAVGPSDIAVDIGSMSKMFAKPRALSHDEILQMIERFANTAELAEQAGFTGVQIHAAHGYLISQFLSPLTNNRTDQWGGSLANRASFLFETIKAIRARVSDRFCVAVKINSADFQKGGFSLEDAKWVVSELKSLAVDLVELSGGSYESPAMEGHAADDSSTAKREAYFVDFAREIATVTDIPIMVTGGISRLSVAEDALSNNAGGFGVSVLGIARAFAYAPDLPNQWKNGRMADIHIPDVSWKNATLASLATMGIAKVQLERMSKGKAPKASSSAILAVLSGQYRTRKLTKRYLKWRANA